MEGHLLCDQPEHKAVDWRQDGRQCVRKRRRRRNQEEEEEEWGGHREIKMVHKSQIKEHKQYKMV